MGRCAELYVECDATINMLTAGSVLKPPSLETTKSHQVYIYTVDTLIVLVLYIYLLRNG